MQVERQFLPFLVKLGPPALRRFVAEHAPIKAVRRLVEIVDVMDRTSVEVLTNKKAALAQGDAAVMKQIGQGKDIMSILSASRRVSPPPDPRLMSDPAPVVVRANANASEEERLPETEILAQMS